LLEKGSLHNLIKGNMRITSKLCILVFAIAVLIGYSLPSSAQAPSCRVVYHYWFPDWRPADLHDCQHGTNYEDICLRNTVKCPSAHAVAETCPWCQAGAPKPTGGRPISLANGNTFIDQIDVNMPGLGGGLSLARKWNSAWPTSQALYKNTGIFGPNWRSTYEERIFLDTDDYYYRYARGDGSFWSLGYSDGDGSTTRYAIAAPADVNAFMSLTIVNNQTSLYTITFRDGEKRIFDVTTGNLQQIIDRNGNPTTLTYDGSARLTTVTDPAGRHLYFNYALAGSPYLVTSVTSDPAANVTINYTYDTNTPPRLIKVTRPDNTYVTFEYDANSLISAVKDMNGKVLESHTYDSQARGLTSSEANGVNAVTITYPTN
jgi:YD repeat-containing protein